jgi:hypothetical protein
LLSSEPNASVANAAPEHLANNFNQLVLATIDEHGDARVSDLRAQDRAHRDHGTDVLSDN